MGFLIETDYDPQLRGWVREIITQGNPLVQTQAELAAQAEMESYLRDRYKVAEIFDTVQPAEDRNALVVMYMVDIATYHLHANISPENVPEIRQIRYDAAIMWLKNVAAGKISPNLPSVNDGSEDDSIFFFGGSNEKTSERY